MRRTLCIFAVVACSSKKETPPDPVRVPVPEPPLHDAVGNADMKALVYDLLAGQACEKALHHFSGIKDRQRKGIVDGQIWVRDCKITNEGKQLVAEVSGSGWQWTEKVEKKAGGTFEVKQYVKFDVTAKLAGTVDLAYEPKNHVATLWFTPTAPADVKFTPIGDIEVNRDDTWSSIIGGAGAIIGQAPEDAAEDTAVQKGTEAVGQSADKGFEIAVDLCTNTTRMALKRLPKGQMPKPSVGETHKIQIELQNYGVIIYGPYQAPHGMTLDVDVSGGAARVNLACLEQGEETAQAFLDNKPNTAKPIAAEVISGHATLKAPKERCPLVVVARSIQPQPVTLSFVRPAAEATRAAGGPLAACRK